MHTGKHMHFPCNISGKLLQHVYVYPYNKKEERAWMNNLIFHLKRWERANYTKGNMKKEIFYFHKYFYMDINEVGIENQ